VASEAHAVNPQPVPAPTEAPAAVASRPAVEAPSTEVASHVTAPGIERRIERFRAADVDGMGLTREQMTKNFPHLADRFDAMDTDHDGRVELSELIAAFQHMTPQARDLQ